jgi:pyrroloquinoline quinone biosynthesis protein D
VTTRVLIAADSVPRLPAHAHLRFDRTRERWVVLAPERVFVPDEIALEILKACDGVATVEAICARLAAQYQADADEVRRDVIEMLQDLADKGTIVT